MQKAIKAGSRKMSARKTVRVTNAETVTIDAPVKKSTRARKPATRSELKRAQQVKKQNAIRKKREEENIKRFKQGKKLKPGVNDVKPSIWEKMAEDQLYAKLRQMGDSTKAIDRFQRNRVMFALVICLFGLLLGKLFHPWLYLVGPVGGVVAYKMKAAHVNNYYKAWKFERQLNFSKFMRLVIPYLKKSNGNTALYTIFNKILNRTEKEADKRSLYQLMGEMGDNPTDIQPFLDFAERSSGTDMSFLFMSTIFDFQQSTFDVSVIDELGKMASEDMMNAIDEIIAFKLKRFVMFPTKVVMTSFILVAGLGVSMMIYNFHKIGFSTSTLKAPNIQSLSSGATSGAVDSKKDAEKSSSPTDQNAASKKDEMNDTANKTDKAKSDTPSKASSIADTVKKKVTGKE